MPTDGRSGIRLTQEVSVEGLRGLRRLLTPPDELLADPWKTAMIFLAESGEGKAKAGAPVATGRLREKVGGRVQKKPMPMWVAIRARGLRKARAGATSRSAAYYRRGYPYPRLLNYSPKHGHRFWFDTAVSPMLATADEALEKAGDEIARLWATKYKGE